MRCAMAGTSCPVSAGREWSVTRRAPAVAPQPLAVPRFQRIERAIRADTASAFRSGLFVSISGLMPRLVSLRVLAFDFQRACRRRGSVFDRGTPIDESSERLFLGDRIVRPRGRVPQPHRPRHPWLRRSVEWHNGPGQTHCVHHFARRDSDDHYTRTRLQRLFRVADLLELEPQHRPTSRVHSGAVPAVHFVVPRVCVHIGQSD